MHTPTSSGPPKSAVKIPTLMSQIIVKTLITLQLIALMSDDPHWLEQVGMVQHCTPMQILIEANFALNVLECLPLLFQIQVLQSHGYSLVVMSMLLCPLYFVVIYFE